MALQQDELLYTSLRWSIILITIVNIFYTLYLFYIYLRDSTRDRSIRLIAWATIGVIVFALGLYGAALEKSPYLIAFGVILVLNSILGLFQSEIYKGSLLMSLVLIILTFIFAYFVHKKGR